MYLIGSLRNRKVIQIANELQTALSVEVFADWTTPGPHADDFLRDYIKQRGGGYKEALQSYAAKHVFEFDKFHLDRSDGAVLVMPAGRSCYLELGYICGQGKPGYILWDKEPPRYDIMVQFAKSCFSVDELVEKIRGDR